MPGLGIGRGSFFASCHYSPGYMDKCKRYIVDHADSIIAIWDGRPSGTGKTVTYGGAGTGSPSLGLPRCRLLSSGYETLKNQAFRSKPVEIVKIFSLLRNLFAIRRLSG